MTPRPKQPMSAACGAGAPWFARLSALLGYAVPAGLLGDPVQGLTHYLRQGPFHLLLLTLLVSPLASLLAPGQLIKLRRPSGSGAPPGRPCTSWSGWGWILCVRLGADWRRAGENAAS